MAMLAFAVGVFGLMFVFTWLYQNTHGSLLIATAFHASANTWTTVFQVPSSSPAFSWLMAAAALLVSAIVLAAGSARSAPRRPLEPLSSSKAVARP